jgi:hypothetical protein
MSIIFEAAPAVGENIELNQSASLLEYDYTPIVKTFSGDGSTTEFDFGTDILNPMCLSVNISGKELQKSEFSVKGDGHTVLLSSAPSADETVQIMSTGKTSYITVSPNSIGTTEIKDGSITNAKLAEKLPVNVDSIPNGAITSAMLANGSVQSAKLADGAVLTTNILDKAVTEAKLSTTVQEKLLGTENVKSANLANTSVGYDKLGEDLKNLLTTVQSDIAEIKKKLNM